ncbi:MAG TPA: hypothetical protein VF778_04255 [Xanthobacteraceae bacterium]
MGYSLRDLELEAQSMPSSFQVLRNAGANVTGFGGFVGYNSQWQDLVVGVEANYTHSPFTIVANSTPISLVVPAGGNTDSVNISGTGSLSMTDYGSLRARAGWILGDFLPLRLWRLRARARQLYGRHARIRAAGPSGLAFAMHSTRHSLGKLCRFFLPQ